MVKSWKSFLSIKYYFNLLVVYCMLQCTFSAAIESKMVKEETCDGGFLWRCIECGHSSKRRDNIRTHIESKHIVSDGFNCTYCGRFFSNKHSMQTHVSKYHRNL